MKRRVEGRDVPLGELLDNLPEHLAQSPKATATQDYDAAYRAWSNARYEYVAAHGYDRLELMREDVARMRRPPKERS